MAFRRASHGVGGHRGAGAGGRSAGIIAELAGALAPAALTGRLISGVEPGTTVVCVLSGGNNDIRRYAEIIERAMLHEGRKHYFLVEFHQEPGALRRFLDEVLGPEDDIALFEYVKRNNRETGPADPEHEPRAANELTITDWDPLSKQPMFKTAAAAVRLRTRDGQPCLAPTNTASAPVHPDPCPTAGGAGAHAQEVTP